MFNSVQAVPPRAAEPVKQEPAVIALDDDDDDDEAAVPKMTAFKAKTPVAPAVRSDPSGEMAKLLEENLRLKRKLEEKEASEGERTPVVPKTLFTPSPGSKAAAKATPTSRPGMVPQPVAAVGAAGDGDIKAGEEALAHEVDISAEDLTVFIFFSRCGWKQL